MDPTLTRAAAHKVFGDLYRKSRPPELQEQVDKVIESVSDVFARIQRIEAIDAAAGKQKTGTDSGLQKRPVRPTTTSPTAVQKIPIKKPDARRGGILGTILGGGDIGVWGKETETLASGFLGRNLRLSKKAEDLFSALHEDQIVAAIKCFRFATRVGWSVWDPATYNTVVAAYQFFTEFVNMTPILRRVERQESLLHETLKMQRIYAVPIQYPNYKRLVGENFVRFTGDQREIAGNAEVLKQVMSFIGTLETKAPSLKNVICAFYGLARKKVVTWAEVSQELAVGKPALNKYRAPESIMQQIHGTIKKLQNQIDAKRADIHEIEENRAKYFEYDAAGKVKTEFLNSIVQDTTRRIYPDKLVSDAVIKSHKAEPPKLLYTIMKDIDLSTLYLMEGAVHLRDGGNQIEAIVFKQGLFRPVIDEFNGMMREVDIYFRKNKNLAFTFQNFLEVLKKDSSDEEMKRFVAMTRKTNQLFKKMLKGFRTVLENHIAAKQDGPAAQEKIARTKTIPIETFTVGKRYIPFYDLEIVSSNRWNGITVEDAITQLVRNLFNYLFIFRDEELLGQMSSVAKIKAEIGLLLEELKKLGVEYEESAPGHVP